MFSPPTLRRSPEPATRRSAQRAFSTTKSRPLVSSHLLTQILIITFLLAVSDHTLISRAITAEAGPPTLLDERFELPSGFHIYRAAGPELSGGSYALTFDGEGRLLVGDGNAVRRLIDKNDDGVFDSYEVIATGLGWRGPQGLLVYGDKLYAVGGDRSPGL